MTLLIGLGAGLVFGLASAFTNRIWGTILCATPLAVWFIFFGLALRDGLTASETADICYALVGIVIGVFIGQMFDWQKRKTARNTQR